MATPIARCLAFLLLGCPCFQAHSLPVFPGAVGYGTDTVAGRNAAAADIYEVTSLEDNSYSSPSPGTLRYGIEKIARPRIIVFRVSGIIELKRDLIVRATDSVRDYGFLTIAGQTAPAPGITLKNGGIRIFSHDVLIQHIGIRPGNLPDPPKTEDPNNEWELSPPGNRDCIRIEGSNPNNIVVDHVSCSWTTDEDATVWASGGTASNITFSNNIFAEPIQFAGHDKGQHGYGPLAGVGSERVSYIRNVMAFNWERNPLIRDRTKGAQVVNNFIYRPGPSQKAVIQVGSYGGHDTPDPSDDLPNYPAAVSAIGNVIVRAPQVEDWAGATRTSAANGVYISADATSALSLHLSGNYSFDADDDEWYPGGADQYTPPFYIAERTPSAFLPEDPHANSGGSVWWPLSGSPEFLRATVVRGAGKFPGRRDVIDASLVSRMNDPNDSSTWLERIEDLGPNPWSAVDIQNSDPDPDGFQMPANPTADADGDGYKNIEEELHRLAAIVEGRGTDGFSAVFDTFTEGDANGWTTNVLNATGAWNVVGNTLKQTDNTLNGRAVLGGTDFADQVVQARVTIESFSGSGFVAVYGRFNAFDHTYYMTLRSSRLIELKRVTPNGTVAGEITTFSTFALPSTFNLNAPHVLRLEMVGDQLKGYVDGILYVSGTDSSGNGIAAGRAAVGSYLAAVSFDDVFASRFADAAPTVADDFDDGTIGSWVTSEPGLTGAWAVTADPSGSSNRVLRQSLNTANARALWTSTATNQSTQARVKISSFGGNGFVALYARYTDANNAYYVTLRNTRRIELKKITAAGVQTFDEVQLPDTFPLDTWHTLRLEVSGGATTTLRAYLDGELKLAGKDSTNSLSSGKGGVGMYLAAAAFDDVVLTAP